MSLVDEVVGDPRGAPNVVTGHLPGSATCDVTVEENDRRIGFVACLGRRRKQWCREHDGDIGLITQKDRSASSLPRDGLAGTSITFMSID